MKKPADNIFNFFLDQVRENNQSLIFVTHNKNYAKMAKYEYTISKHKSLFNEISIYTFKKSNIIFFIRRSTSKYLN